MPEAPLLEVEGLAAGYLAGSRVLDGISLTVAAGEIVALIGRNGMGKTTFLKTLAGHIRPSAGRIRLAGRDIAGLEPHEIAAAGIGYVPQGREIFSAFTVEQNLLMGVLGKKGLPKAVPGWAWELFPVLRERRRQRGGTMSGGQQQQLAILRALVGRPRLLLLDEPSEGLAPVIIQQIGEVVRKSKQKGLTILLVEQNFRFAASVADRHYVVSDGRIVDSFRNDEIDDPRTQAQLETYIGV